MQSKLCLKFQLPPKICADSLHHQRRELYDFEGFQNRQCPKIHKILAFLASQIKIFDLKSKYSL